MEDLLNSPLPAAVLGNLVYPFKYLRTNIMLGRILKPFEIYDGTFVKIPSFWDNFTYVRNRQPFYTLWEGFTPTVVADFTQLATYSLAGVIFFKRKFQKREHYRLTESNQLALEECFLMIISNVVSHPIRNVAWRTMAQLTRPDCSIYGYDILSGLKHIIEVEGLFALFKGVLPMVLYDIIRIGVTRCVFEFALEFTPYYRRLREKKTRSREETRKMRQFQCTFIIFVRCLLHPLSVLSLMMTLNNSDVASELSFKSSIECLRHLYSSRALYRGAVSWLPWYSKL